MDKEMFLKKISLLNFKGIKNQSFEFENRETTVVGANGTGKTSLYDAFVWCLFGKDHLGRSDYQLKTIRNGQTVPKAECEVELRLLINGEEMRLKRIYSENWVRPKGSTEEVFKGNETSYYINDIQVKKMEYDMEIAGICNETAFRAITNFTYFPNLTREEQRKILFKMAGDISNEAIAGDNMDFQEFLKLVTGASFEEFRADINAKKKRIKEDLDFIPTRIDELKRTIPEALDWNKLKVNIDAKKSELESINNQLTDESRVSEEESRKRIEIRAKINGLKQENQQIEFSAQRKKNDAIARVKSDLRQLLVDEGNLNRDYNTRLQRLTYLKERHNRLGSELEQLTVDWKKINAEQLVFNDDEFICPACKRPLDVSDIESKQNEMTENFNSDKSKRLEANGEKGSILVAERKAIIDEIKQIGELKEADTSDIKKKITEQEENLKKLEEKSVELPQEHAVNINYIAKYEAELNAPIEQSATQTELKERKNAISAQIETLNSDYAKKEIIENSQKRIRQLEEQQVTMNQEMAELERREFLLKSFEFARNEKYESEINRMFRFVKFTLFKKQVDGQIVPDCECMANGVPYSTQNKAMQVAMGLDVIDAISRKEGIYAPIWIDNRESVTSIPEIHAQVINLVVSPNEPVLRKIQ
jgi:chromosome segregation ATPase